MISAYRPQDDSEYLFDTWLRTYLKSQDEYELPRPYHFMPKPHYFAAQKLLIASLLKRSTVLVYRGEDDSFALRGYIVGELVDDKPIVHWVYTRSMWRRHGVANALFGALAISLGVELRGGHYTHQCVPGAYMLHRQGLSFEAHYLRERRP